MIPTLHEVVLSSVHFGGIRRRNKKKTLLINVKIYSNDSRKGE